MGSVGRALQLLGKQYDVALREPRDPFALIVWENCAYLVDDERRERTFSELVKRVGLTPATLLAAGAKKVERAIVNGGMQLSHRTTKVLRCAVIALEQADGDLAQALGSLDPKNQRKLLKLFPGIADPGADKVLLLCAFSNGPALESNGLRVLERLGVIPSGLAYAASYKAGVASIAEAKVDVLEAFALLRDHGRTLCKRNEPACPVCPLRKTCAFGKSQE